MTGNPCGWLRHPSVLEFARSTLSGLGDGVAERDAPPHHRAPLTDVSEARRMRRDNDTGANGLRRADLVQPESRHERVEVNQVRALPLQPRVEVFRAARPRAPLDFVTRGPRRDGIPE